MSLFPLRVQHQIYFHYLPSALLFLLLLQIWKSNQPGLPSLPMTNCESWINETKKSYSSARHRIHGDSNVLLQTQCLKL